ncbi:hypothetical protein ACA910_015589 [Epithemia clementina (nom. ined.)]
MLFSAGAFSRIAVMATLVLQTVATGRALRCGRTVDHRRLADSVSPASFEHSMKVDDEVAFYKVVTIGQEITTAKVDVFLLTDSTGSMGGIISSVKTSALDIIDQVSGLGDVAFGAGQYRDVGDAFVYNLDQDMTTDRPAVQTGINTWSAGGGGDLPDANLFALKQVAELTTWREDSTRILVWFGDAPGHPESSGVNIEDATEALLAKNIKVQALDVAGLDEVGQATYIASMTSGGYYFVNPSNVVTVIKDAIEGALKDYFKVELQSTANLAAIQVSTDAPFEGTYSRETTETYHFGVIFKCLAEGTHVFEIKVLVDGGLVATESDTIECTANQPPDCSTAVSSPSKIWPPNHKFTSLVVSRVTDPDGDAVTIRVTSIYQDEPVNTLGDGNTCADATITEAGVASVRAERSGTNKVPGDGRVYHVNFMAEDSKGGTCEGKVQVCVPHDKNRMCLDGGPLYDSTICV